ncbi:hypothetical protein [Rhodococcus sp. NPDC049939]|uniref:hypothetical protein n=1 Tax=Rhodococcus sp. NPDC049939 TaxID=3155511 RepID=UPI0033CD4337
MSATKQITPEQAIDGHELERIGHDLGCTGCNWSALGDESFAAHLVRLIRETGHEIVRLPEDEGEDYYGQVWLDEGDIRVDCTGTHGRTAHINGVEVRPNYLRRTAAEFLAAARLVEEGLP